MEAIGRHLVMELSNCNSEHLEDLEYVRSVMLQSALEARAEIMESTFHKFSPHGVSGVVVIAESHLSIHTWPEFGYAAIDIYTCGCTCIPEAACSYAARKLGATHVYMSELKRGLPMSGNRYSHEAVVFQREEELNFAGQS